MASHLATRAAALGGLLRTASGLQSFGLATAAGLGVACRTSGGALVPDWWGIVLSGWLLGWAGSATLLSRSPEALATQARRLARVLSPLGLWLVLPFLLPAVKPRLLLDAWALGGCGAMAAALWVLPRCGEMPGALRRIVHWTGAVWVLTLLWGSVYFTATALHWWRFGQYSQDMAIYEQAMYNTLHGHFLAYSTDIRFPRTELHRFADHFEPIILGFLPLYALWRTPLWFLLAQAFVPATGAVPLARITAGWCRSPTAGLVMACLYLLFPGLHIALWHDFHPIVLAGALVLWGVHWGLQRRTALCVLMLVLAMACKENVPGTVATVGLYLAWRGQRRLGLGIAAGAVAWGLVAVLLVPRLFSPTSASFYSHLLTAPAAAVAGSAGGTTAYLAHRLDYLTSVLGGVGGACVLAPAELAISGPDLALAMLSSNRWMNALTAHYHVLVSVGIMLGAARALAWLRARAPGVGAAALDTTPRVARRAALLSLVLISLLMLRGEQQLLTTFSWSWFAGRSGEEAGIARLLKVIPDGAAVLTNDGGLASHLARRRWLVFHYAPGAASDAVLEGYETVEYVALNVDRGQSDPAEVTRCYSLDLLGHEGPCYVWRVRHAAAEP